MVAVLAFAVKMDRDHPARERFTTIPARDRFTVIPRRNLGVAFAVRTIIIFPQTPFVNAICYSCQRKGHIAAACTLKKYSGGPNNPRTHYVADITEEPIHEEYVFHVTNQLSSRDSHPRPITITCTINNQATSLELDTGSAVSLMSEETFNTLPELTPLDNSELKLSSFTGHAVEILGKTDVMVVEGDSKLALPIYIYRGRGPSLCGRSWMSSLNITVNAASNSRLRHVTASVTDDHMLQDPDLTTILTKNKEVFSNELGCLKGTKVHLYVRPDAQPRYFKPRSIPYAYKPKVEEELDRLEKLGVIVPVPHSRYAAPIVPVRKPNGSIRICGDYTLTANASIDAEKYPLPKADDIFATLANCKFFSRLDMRDAYNQLQLDEASQELVTINTTKGLYRYTRLPFGVSSASAVFQRNMEMVLQNKNGVIPFQDDILIGGKSKDDHFKRLDSVLALLAHSGLKLRQEKCKFAQESLDFLGHHLDATGLHPQASKVAAVREAPSPTNVDELRAFLGLVNYYAKFIPDNASRLTPLYALLQKEEPWLWTPEREKAFEDTKIALSSAPLLIHYDPKKPLLVACDASPVGISAVLSHKINGEDDQPIAFASRTLSTTEKNYSQIDKEALSIIFGVKKFREYLLGHKFVLITDHKPLVAIFSEHKLVPATAAARLQRWAAYYYTIRHKKGRHHTNADCLSRLPLPNTRF